MKLAFSLHLGRAHGAHHHHRRRHHRRDTVSGVTPAPTCMPAMARTRLTVAVEAWGAPISCSVVRFDERSHEVLASLPEHLGWSPHAERAARALVGWPDHNEWHEARGEFSSTMRSGSRYFRVRLTSLPIHHERRRHVRAHKVRPVSIHVGREKIEATTVDISEAAMRVVMGSHERIQPKDSVHFVLAIADRFHGGLATFALDGSVFRVRALDGAMTGRKEVVILFGKMTPGQIDFIRGLVYDLDLQDRRPPRDDE